MIRVTVGVNRNGALRYFSSEGHAGRSEGGQDVVCAAATALLRTAARLLYRQAELVVRGQAPEAGRMEMKLQNVPQHRQDWLAGVSDFLIAGLRDIEEEHRGTVELKIEDAEEGEI